MDKTIEFLHLMKNKDASPEEIHQKIIEYTTTVLGGKKLILKEIDPEMSWGLEHCEYCFKELSAGKEAYSDKEEKYWLCKNCYNDHKEELKIKQ
jgi:hypothetical protein